MNSGSGTVPGPADPPAAAIAARAGSMSPACAATFGVGVSPPTIFRRFVWAPPHNLDSLADVVAKVGPGQAVRLPLFASSSVYCVGVVSLRTTQPLSVSTLLVALGGCRPSFPGHPAASRK